MYGRIARIATSARLVPGSLVLLAALLGPAAAAPHVTFSVGPDEALRYPNNLPSFPDEHTTILPPAPGSTSYLVFAASSFTGGTTGGGAVVLETQDLVSFAFAAGYSSPVMSPPLRFTACDSAYNHEFDENYAAPGSVVQDPTLPPGNLIMVYEAENHCPSGVWQFHFYATIGLARSPDRGKTWPRPANGELGGPERYPILRSVTPPTAGQSRPLGDALPSAFVDTGASPNEASREAYLYVIYIVPEPGAGGMIRMARAKLGTRQLSFTKWFDGAFSEPGLGGRDSGVLPAKGCNGYQTPGDITYNDALGAYLLTFVCVSYRKDQSGRFQPYQAAWYFATATSLDRQDWSAPQLIENSQGPVTAPCSAGGGKIFDGWYPSFMSPGSAAGHTAADGFVFFLGGCDTSSARRFTRRAFHIRADTR